MPAIMNKRIFDMYRSYLKTSSESYDDLEMSFLDSMVLDYINTGVLPEDTVLVQILAKIGAISDEKNKFKIMFNLVKNLYGVNIDITDVCAGERPIFSELVDEEQQRIGKGTITAIDPKIKNLKNGNIKIIKEPFTDFTYIKKYQLGVAIEPHNITDTFIRKFNEDEVRLLLYCCNCIPDYCEFDSMSVKEWQDSTKHYVKSTLHKGWKMFTKYTDDNHLIIGTDF